MPVTRTWGMIIHLVNVLPRPFSDLTQGYRRGIRASSREAPCIGLAPGGVYHAGHVTIAPVRSYRTLSPLPCTHGGLLSVALSFESPRLAVNQHHALRSSDFTSRAYTPATIRPGRRDRGAILRIFGRGRYSVGFAASAPTDSSGKRAGL